MAKIWIKTKLQNLAMKKKEAYLTRSINLPRINKDSLLERAADNSGISRGQIYLVASAIVNEFKNFVLAGHPVELPFIGSFRFGVNAYASKTEEEAGAQQVYRRKIIFTPSVELKKELNKVNLELRTLDMAAEAAQTDYDNADQQNGEA